MLNFAEGERIADCRAVRHFDQPGHFLMMATRKGLVKKTPLEAYSRPMRGGTCGDTTMALTDSTGWYGSTALPQAAIHYRAAIFPLNAEQRQVASAYLAQMRSSRVWDRPIVVEIEPRAPGLLSETTSSRAGEMPLQRWRSGRRGGSRRSPSRAERRRLRSR